MHTNDGATVHTNDSATVHTNNSTTVHTNDGTTVHTNDGAMFDWINIYLLVVLGLKLIILHFGLYVN